MHKLQSDDITSALAQLNLITGVLRILDYSFYVPEDWPRGGSRQNPETVFNRQISDYLQMIKTASDNLSEKFNKLRVVANIRSIRNRDFSIIASNCTGALPYRFLKMQYTSPTVNLFFFAPCYLKFVKNLEYYLSVPLKFSPRSLYPNGESTRLAHGKYPIGRLDDIEIHFMHYANTTDASRKWNARKERINRDNLILAFTDKDLCTPALLKEFDALDFQNKYVLTANVHPHIRSSIHVPHFSGQSEIGDCYTRYDHLTHIDFQARIDQRSFSSTADASAVFASI